MITFIFSIYPSDTVMQMLAEWYESVSESLRGTIRVVDTG